MSSAVWPLLAVAAFGAGAVYIATRDEARKPRTSDKPPDGPQDPKDPLGPGGVKAPTPREPPPEPAGGWDVYLTPMTAAEALEAVKQEGSATTGPEAVTKALERVFDVPWIEPLAVWQKRARSLMWSTLHDLSEWKTWTEEYDAPTDMPYIWWLQAEASVTFCKFNQGVSGTDKLRLCAARIMFPDRQWPPSGRSSPWMREVWRRLAAIII